MTPQVPIGGQPDQHSADSQGGRAQRHFARLIMAMSAGLVVVVLLVIFLGVKLAEPGADDEGALPPTSSTPSTSPPPSTPPPQSTPIVIDQGVDPPLCASFGGSGDVPPGKTLWLAVVSDERRYYFFPATPEPALRRWAADNVTLGIPEEKPGEPFTIIAVLADAKGDKNIEKLAGKGARSLPAGIQEHHRIYVKRGHGEQACQE